MTALRGDKKAKKYHIAFDDMSAGFRYIIDAQLLMNSDSFGVLVLCCCTPCCFPSQTHQPVTVTVVSHSVREKLFALPSLKTYCRS